jgi:hypothetical protein
MLLTVFTCVSASLYVEIFKKFTSFEKFKSFLVNPAEYPTLEMELVNKQLRENSNPFFESIVVDDKFKSNWYGTGLLKVFLFNLDEQIAGRYPTSDHINRQKQLLDGFLHVKEIPAARTKTRKDPKSELQVTYEIITALVAELAMVDLDLDGLKLSTAGQEILASTQELITSLEELIDLEFSKKPKSAKDTVDLSFEFIEYERYKDMYTYEYQPLIPSRFYPRALDYFKFLNGDHESIKKFLNKPHETDLEILEFKFFYHILEHASKDQGILSSWTAGSLNKLLEPKKEAIIKETATTKLTKSVDESTPQPHSNKIFDIIYFDPKEDEYVSKKVDIPWTRLIVGSVGYTMAVSSSILYIKETCNEWILGVTGVGIILGLITIA